MLNLDDIRRITLDVIAVGALPLSVLGIVNGSGDSAYTEVLIHIRGCHAEPCQIALGVFRTTRESDLRREIAEKLHEHGDHRVG